MNENYTHIELVLDASGSMDSIKKDTIGGFNTFLKGQKETAKKGDTFTFTTFSSNYGGYSPWKYIYRNADISEVPELNSLTYQCTGGTALLDTLGDTITDLGAFLRNLSEEKRPGKVIFVILTDGEENSSKRFSKHNINMMIKEQTDKWKWEFVFLGANQDAIQVGASYGIAAGQSMTYAANELGTKSTFDSLTRSLNTYKMADVGVCYAASGASFTNSERTASMGAQAGGVDLVLGGGFVGDATSNVCINLSGNPLNGWVTSNNDITPLNPSITENVKDDSHEVVV